MTRTATVAVLALLLTACEHDLLDVSERAVPSGPAAAVAGSQGDDYGNLVLSHAPAGYWRHKEADLYGAPSIDGELVLDVSGSGSHGIYRSLPSNEVASGIFHADSLAFAAGNPMRNYPGGPRENFGYFSDGPDEATVDSGGARIERSLDPTPARG